MGYTLLPQIWYHFVQSYYAFSDHRYCDNLGKNIIVRYYHECFFTCVLLSNLHILSLAVINRHQSLWVIFYSFPLMQYLCSLVFTPVLLGSTRVLIMFIRILLVFTRVHLCSTCVNFCSLVFNWIFCRLLQQRLLKINWNYEYYFLLY